jgi:hypothetical protein
MNDTSKTLWTLAITSAAICLVIVTAWITYGIAYSDARFEQQREITAFQDQAVAAGYAVYDVQYNGWHGNSGFHWIKVKP